MIDLHDNAAIAELARQQSVETRAKVYGVDAEGRDAVYIAGELRRWAYLDDIEIIYDDADAERWEKILHGRRH
jgi:hypothetical protein|nr:hypothetical protein [uncultured Devosia sp.]